MMSNKIEKMIFLLVFISVHFIYQVNCKRCSADSFLDAYNKNFADVNFRKYSAMFNRVVDTTNETTRLANEANDAYRRKMEEARRNASSYNTSQCSTDTKRQLDFLLRNKESANQTIAKMVEDLKTDMENTYSGATIPRDPRYVRSIGEGTQLNLGQIMEIMSKSRDPTERRYLWLSWRKVIKEKLRAKYINYVRLNNIGAVENGFPDAGAFHRSFYDVDDVQKIAENFLEQMGDVYMELHGYVRHKLKQVYPDQVTENGPIPAHLFGNIFGMSWGNIYDLVVPYPDEPSLDISKKLQERHSINGMLKMAELFFTSLGWRKLPPNFWEYSVFRRITGREMDCQPKALDLSKTINGVPDVRMVQCLDTKTQSDFVTLHHELGHIYYFLQYAHQPLQYREGANPGFHEAVGDFISLSAQTPHYLHASGLLDQVSLSEETDINFLLKTALDQIAFIPYSYILDLWSWNVYRGKIKPDEYNKVWWEYRKKYQGIANPDSNTTDDGGFDPGAKQHIATDTPYIRYFFSVILMFTFHKRSCDISNNTQPLHRCSIYNSKVVGKKFGDMLKQGRSRPWPEILKDFTGKSDISVEPVKEYFSPLMQWLKNYRAEKGYAVGWDGATSGASVFQETRILVLATTAIFIGSYKLLT